MSLVCFHLIFHPRLIGAISLLAKRVQYVNADFRPFLPINRGFSPSFSFFFLLLSITLHAMASSSDANASLLRIEIAARNRVVAA